IADAAPDPDALRRRLLAAGHLPPGAAGANELAEWLRVLRAPARRWREWAQGPAQSRAFDLDLGEYRLQGRIGAIHAPGLLQFRAGKPHGKAQLRLGIDALIWSALGETRPVHRLIAEGDSQILAPPAADSARAALIAMLDLHTR